MKLNIQTKLIGSFFIVVAIMIGLGVFALYELSAINTHTNTIAESVVPSIQTIQQYRLAANRYRMQQLEHTISNDQAAMDKIEANLAAETAIIEKAMKDYTASLIYNADDRALMEGVSAAWQAYLAKSAPFLEPSRTKRNEEAAVVLQEAEPAFTTFRTEMDKWTAFNTQLSDQEMSATHTAYTTAQTLVIGALIGAGIIALAMGFLLSRSITGPLTQGVTMIQEMSLGHLSTRLRLNRTDEIGILARTMDQFADDLQNSVIGTMKKIAAGDLNAAVSPKDSRDEIAPALNQTVESLRGLVAEANMLTKAAVEGRLSIRGSAAKFQGGYRDIVQGVNDTLDAVIGPLNVSADYVDRISKGDMPPKIADTYNGDFNEIKNNLNTLIDTLNLFIEEMGQMSRAQNAGDIDAKIAVERFSGVYRQMAQGVIDQVFEHIRIKRQIVAVVNKYGEGDFTATMEKLPGKKAFINETLDIVRDNLRSLAAETNMLTKAAIEGKLATRADAGRFKGDWMTLVKGVNDTLDAVIGPLNVTATYVNRIAKGDIPPAITDTYNGDFNDIKNNLNELIRSLNEIARMAVEIAAGNLALEVKPRSEQDQLLIALRQMLTNLRELIGQVQEGAEQVAEASQQLNTAANQSSQAGQQVANTIQQVAQGTGQQTQAVNDATSGVEQISRAAEGIAKGSQEQAQGVQKTSDLVSEMATLVGQVGQVADAVTKANTRMSQAARNGAAAVNQTGQGMESIRARTSITADKVKEMGSRSKEIGRIIETIDDIADKTDMLALNAAVEAARAGEAGRGFAVVADQVRKLSEDSKVATRDIGVLIERVQDTINEAIAAMQSSTVEVDNGVKLTKETTQSLQDILQAAEEAVNLAERIDQAVSQLKQKSQGVVTSIETVSAVVEENTAVAEQMAANSEEVSASMESVAGIAEQNSASAEEVSALAEEMSAQAEEVVASAEELSALAEELRSSVAQFRVADQETAWSQPRQSPRKAKREVKATHAPVTHPRLQPAVAVAELAGNGKDEA